MEWEVLRTLENDFVVVVISKFVLFVICSLYGLIITTVGLIFTSDEITSTLNYYSSDTMYLVFLIGQVFMLVSYLGVEFFSPYFN